MPPALTRLARAWQLCQIMRRGGGFQLNLPPGCLESF